MLNECCSRLQRSRGCIPHESEAWALRLHCHDLWTLPHVAEVRLAFLQVRSWLSALPGGRSSVVTVDSNASQSMRLPAVGMPGAAVSPPPNSTARAPAMPAATAATLAASGTASGTAWGAAAAGTPAAAAAAQQRPPGSGFLVQQPSSKLWMEAVPMRQALHAFADPALLMPWMAPEQAS